MVISKIRQGATKHTSSEDKHSGGVRGARYEALVRLQVSPRGRNKSLNTAVVASLTCPSPNTVPSPLLPAWLGAPGEDEDTGVLQQDP